MSNYSLKIRSISVTALASLLACLSAPSMAQDNMPPTLMLPGAPAAAPVVVTPKLPEGATLSGSSDRVKNMSAEAGRGLDELLGNTITERDRAEIKTYAQEKREQLFLQLQLEKAQIARELYFEINGNEGESKEEAEKLKEENTRLKSEIESVKASASNVRARAQIESDPVVATIFGTSGKLSAQIVTEKNGTAIVTTGTVLPNGMRVASISKNGVVVMHDGNTKTLLFAGP